MACTQIYTNNGIKKRLHPVVIYLLNLAQSGYVQFSGVIPFTDYFITTAFKTFVYLLNNNCNKKLYLNTTKLDSLYCS